MMSGEKIEVSIPDGHMNVGIYTEKAVTWLRSDTNDSAKWEEFKKVLPAGDWHVYSYKTSTIVVLVNKAQ